MLYVLLLIILSFMVTWTRNVFMSLMYSVLLYINATCVLLVLGFEFLALINLLVYVGALAVLFLFVIMLLEVPTTELRAYYRGWSVIGALAYMGLVISGAAKLPGTTCDVPGLPASQESIAQIGYAFYLQYADVLVLNSLVLTIALFGALVLAHTRS